MSTSPPKVRPGAPPRDLAALPCGELLLAHSRRVLVADDSAVNRKIVSKTLETLGFNVTAVNDGKEAVAAATAEGYDLVLLDCHMPEMDGFSAAQHIRSMTGEAGKVPIIALTGSANDDHVKCIEAGMNAVLSKPLQPEALCEAMRQWLG